jgi:chlorite dismutase
MQHQQPEKRGNPGIPASPEIPLTLEGSAVLHQMVHVNWPEWKSVSEAVREEIVQEAVSAFAALEKESEGQSAIFTLLGHKGDLMLVHFRRTFDELNAIERTLIGLRLWDYVEVTNSYVSVVELGLYESSVKLYESLAERGIEPGGDEWSEEIEKTLARQAKAMTPRLYPSVPERKYICFYPMDRKRGEQKNWYTLPIRERQRLMAVHGLVGRKYAGAVKQIISGSIGFDDWEWGVDLFADDPVIFKKLIYEMRFDEVSADYATFGPFYTGIRLPAAGLSNFLIHDSTPDD